MKNPDLIFRFIILFLFTVLSGQPLFAQGFGESLTFQGIDKCTLHSAGGRSMAGISIGMSADPGYMFQNPAALTLVDKLSVSIGGLSVSEAQKQEQQYAPVRYYSNLSLLLEGLTVDIPDPDTTLFGFTAQDTVQRPFDDIGPDWSRSKSRNLPTQALIAMPLALKEMKIVAGIGIAEYANMDYYFQNNNVLSPSILSQRPLPTLRPTDDKPLEVDWSQSVYSREGSIHGYGFSLAGNLQRFNLSFGFSGMFLGGSTDDYEQHVGRGRLTFFSNAFRADSVFSRTTKTGSSEYSGQEYTISSILKGRYVSVGFSLKLPTTITRKYKIKTTVASGIALDSYSTEGKDKLKLPWRGSLGLSMTPREDLTIGLEYEYRPYESVIYISSEDVESSPWLSASLYRLGVEYRLKPWLALRGGMKGEAEIFEPEGSYINDDPVNYTVYSAGFGIRLNDACLNVAYENALVKYQDIWASAISKNSERTNRLIAQFTYEIPWMHVH